MRTCEQKSLEYLAKQPFSVVPFMVRPPHSTCSKFLRRSMIPGRWWVPTLRESCRVLLHRFQEQPFWLVSAPDRAQGNGLVRTSGFDRGRLLWLACKCRPAWKVNQEVITYDERCQCVFWHAYMQVYGPGSRPSSIWAGHQEDRFEQAWKNLSKDMKQVCFRHVCRAQADLVNYSTTKHSAQKRRWVQRKPWLRWWQRGRGKRQGGKRREAGKDPRLLQIPNPMSCHPILWYPILIGYSATFAFRWDYVMQSNIFVSKLIWLYLTLRTFHWVLSIDARRHRRHRRHPNSTGVTRDDVQQRRARRVGVDQDQRQHAAIPVFVRDRRLGPASWDSPIAVPQR